MNSENPNLQGKQVTRIPMGQVQTNMTSRQEPGIALAGATDLSSSPCLFLIQRARVSENRGTRRLAVRRSPVERSHIWAAFGNMCSKNGRTVQIRTAQDMYNVSSILKTRELQNFGVKVQHTIGLDFMSFRECIGSLNIPMPNSIHVFLAFLAGFDDNASFRFIARDRETRLCCCKKYYFCSCWG